MKLGILFDLDGTLLSTLEDLADAVNYTMRCYGCPERTLEEVRAFVGNGARQLIALSLPGKNTDPDVDQVLATYQEYYGTHSQIKTRPYDGILEALEEIRKHFPIAVVSNKPDRATKPLCRHYFGEQIYALGESPACPKKPAPDMLLQAMRDIGVEKCIYVGDSDVDVITAKNAGARCLSVMWGFRDEDCLLQAGATHLCRKPDQMAAMLLEMAREEA